MKRIKDRAYNPEFIEEYKGFTITELVDPTNGEFDGYTVDRDGSDVYDYDKEYSLYEVKKDIDSNFGNEDEYVTIYCGMNGYAADQVHEMTVGELKEMLSEFDDDKKVVVHAGGTYGAKYWGIKSVKKDQN